PSVPARTRVPAVEMSTNENGTWSVAVYPKASGPIVLALTGAPRPRRIATRAQRATGHRRVFQPPALYMGRSSVEPLVGLSKGRRQGQKSLRVGNFGSLTARGVGNPASPWPDGTALGAGTPLR